MYINFKYIHIDYRYLFINFIRLLLYIKDFKLKIILLL